MMLKKKSPGTIKRKLFNGLIMLILTGVLAFVSVSIINTYVKASVEDRIITPDEAAQMDTDCIIVLGAGVWDGGRPSPMLEDRLLQGSEL